MPAPTGNRENMVDSRTGRYTLNINGLETMATFGRQLGALLMPGDVLLLYGGLGAGKTTLTQAIGHGLEVPADYYISSPSFALMHEYPGRCPLYHIDCYRLTGEDDIEGAGLAEYLEPEEGVCVVEWPERLGALTPAQPLRITLDILGEEQRRLVLTCPSEHWFQRLGNLSAQFD